MLTELSEMEQFNITQKANAIVMSCIMINLATEMVVGLVPTLS
jgi:hypothetical protein